MKSNLKSNLPQQEVFAQQPREVQVLEVAPQNLSINNILEMITNKTRRDSKLLSACCDRHAHI